MSTSDQQMVDLPTWNAHHFVLTFLFASFLFFFFFFLRIISRRSNKTGINLPPGPWQFPIIGNLPHLALDLWRCRLPHHAMRSLAIKHGPALMHLKLGQITAIVASTAAAAEEILKSNDINFAERTQTTVTRFTSYGGMDIIFSTYGDYWRQLRKICVLELLSANRVQSFRSIREEEVSNLVNSINNNGKPAIFNISKMTYCMMYDIVTRASIGFKCRDGEFESALNDTTESATGFNLVDLYPSLLKLGIFNGAMRKVERVHERFDRILDRIVREYRKEHSINGAFESSNGGREEMLAVLLKFQADGNHGFVTDDTIKAVILDMLAGGSETSSTTVSWAMSELMNNPSAMRKAQEEVREAFAGRSKVSEEGLHELVYLKLVIKETLRLHPATPLLPPRRCRKTCLIGGYQVPENARVVVNLWAIARDSTIWGDDSEEFLPERFYGTSVDFKGNNYEFLPFGAGRRSCPGIAFAMAGMELVLSHLLYFFDWKLPDHLEKLDMEETFGVTARRRSDLCLRAEPRNVPRP